MAQRCPLPSHQWCWTRLPRRSIGTAADTSAGAASDASRRAFRASLLLESRSFPLQLVLKQLFLVQVRVVSAQCDKFVVRAAFNDLPLAQHDSLVGAFTG